MTDLILPVKRIYFEKAKAGIKTFEYRLRTPYWKKRIEGRTYDCVIMTLGYPSRDDHERRLVRPFRGYEMQTITHKHFGPDPVEVYAIRVN